MIAIWIPGYNICISPVDNQRNRGLWPSKRNEISNLIIWSKQSLSPLTMEVLYGLFSGIHVLCHFCLWAMRIADYPSATYMRKWTVSSLVLVMACRLFGAKPLPEPLLPSCQLDSWEQISVTFESEFDHFHSGKCIWKCRLPKWRPFCSGEGEFTH